MIGDLLQARDLDALPALDRLDEFGRLQQRIMRPRVELGIAAAHLLDMEVARVEVAVREIRDLQFAPRRRSQPRRQIADPAIACHSRSDRNRLIIDTPNLTGLALTYPLDAPVCDVWFVTCGSRDC